MLTILVLTFAVVLQFLAVIYALQLIKLTGRAYSWIFISLALFLMMIRRIIPLYYLTFTNPAYPTNLINESIGLLLSFFMLLGIMGIKKIFIARREAEEALRQSDATMNSIFQAAPVGICIMTDRVFKSTNKYWYEKFGYPEESIIGKSTRMLYENDDEWNRVGQQLYAHLQERGVLSVETRLRRNDGFFRDVIVTAAPILQNDLSAGTVAIIHDITERKETERALKESERKYRELVEHANSIILHWTRDGKITFLNEFGQRFFGYSPEEIIGRHVIGTIVPETSSGGRDLSRLMEQICADPIAFEQNINENICRNGKRVWIAWTNRIVKDTGGQVAEIMSIGTDITELKRAEETIRELNISLGHRIEERTAELFVAKEKAEAADRLKSAFLASMSHELRTPLNSIIGFTGMVLQGLAGPINKEQEKQLGMVRGSARHLLDLINDILDISKIEAGQLQIMSEFFDLRKSIEKAVQIILPLANKKNLRLHFQIGDDVSEIRGDQRRVEQIMINLLSNAVKFTDNGEIILNCNAGNDSITLSVADTGIGIKPENLFIIFDAFRQVDDGITRVQEGTGLGLNITKKLVEMMGGAIHLKSELGKGSIFTIILPITKEQ